MADLNFIENCLTPNAGVPTGKCLWRFDSTRTEMNDGWVFVACNCAGKCCKPPPASAVPDGTYRETECIDCPARRPVSDLPTSQ